MKYLKLNYKRMLMPTLFLTIIGVLVYVLPIMFARVPNSYSGYQNSNVLSFAIFLVGAAIFIPIYEFSSLKTTKGADLYYSLPLTKRKLHLTIYIKGLIELLVSYTIVFILGFIIVNLKGFNFQHRPYFPLFFIGLIGITSYYTFNTAIFLRSNRLIDGLIFILLYMITAFLVISSMLHIYNASYSIISMFPFNPITESFSLYNRLITKKHVLDESINGMYINILIINLINFGVGFLGLLFTKDIKSEDVYQISNTWIGYKVLIPVLLTSLTVLSNISFTNTYNLYILILFVVIAYVGYVIYQRTFKVKWYYLLTLILAILLGIILNIVF